MPVPAEEPEPALAPAAAAPLSLFLVFATTRLQSPSSLLVSMWNTPLYVRFHSTTPALRSTTYQ
jgi:hypothetical protein